MKLPEEIKNKIVEALKPVDPYRVILFGSYAWGNPDKDSDIDLYIVTRDEFIPKNWAEKMRVTKRISSRLLGMRKKYPMDLIVHTKAMHEEFISLKSSFSREIMKNGNIIL